MNASKLQYLLLILAAGAAGVAEAGSGDITRRDQGGGAVELSNLGSDEEAQVVVAAPARAAIEPVARPVPAAAARPVPEVAAIERQAKPAVEGKGKREKSEEELADERNGEGRGEYAAGSANREGYANYGGGFGGYGYGTGGSGGSTGVVDTGATGTGGSSGSTAGGTGGTSVATGSGGSTSTGTGGSGSGYGNSNTSTAGSAPTAGLSPDQMALRVAQYRDMMLNEQRGANGLVANPAVQRRYLMLNRAGYMGLGF